MYDIQTKVDRTPSFCTSLSKQSIKHVEVLYLTKIPFEMLQLYVTVKDWNMICRNINNVN